jgi:hypothetical protein
MEVSGQLHQPAALISVAVRREKGVEPKACGGADCNTGPTLPLLTTIIQSVQP